VAILCNLPMASASDPCEDRALVSVLFVWNIRPGLVTGLLGSHFTAITILLFPFY
jgi:hypothetical protein